MTLDAVALCPRQPNRQTVLDALLEVGPQLGVRPLPAVGLLQLCDARQRTVLTLEGPTLVQVPGEAQRLLGVDPATTDPLWWIQVRAETAIPGAHRLAQRLCAALVARTGGTSWP